MATNAIGPNTANVVFNAHKAQSSIIRQFSFAEDISVGEMMREAVYEYLLRRDQKLAANFLAAGNLRKSVIVAQEMQRASSKVIRATARAASLALLVTSVLVTSFTNDQIARRIRSRRRDEIVFAELNRSFITA